ncbi:MAG TPA: hypothetical protein VK209_01790 [Candidatus Sulfotelmatobacter sp.]|nr:hypothetical protein [Candidatus Sulfotelmatobacter sp.]
MLLGATQVTVGVDVVITIIFEAIPLILGLATLRIALKNSSNLTKRKRIFLARARDDDIPKITQ